MVLVLGWVGGVECFIGNIVCRQVLSFSLLCFGGYRAVGVSREGAWRATWLNDNQKPTVQGTWRHPSRTETLRFMDMNLRDLHVHIFNAKSVRLVYHRPIFFHLLCIGRFYKLVSMEGGFPFLLGCLPDSRTVSYCFSFGHVARYASSWKTKTYGTIAENSSQANL